jgi:hypothetical protein
MTIAELKGKISSSGSNITDRLEDLLTSDVFGPLRYLPAKDALIPVLKKACLFSDTKKNLPIEDSLKFQKMEFWPALGKSEPDVLIEFDNATVLIEAKYLSGKSGSYKEYEDEETEYASANADQLAREFKDLLKLNKTSFSVYVIVYITGHRNLPFEDFANTQKALLKTDSKLANKFNKNAYWLSWFEIHSAIKIELERLFKEKEQFKCAILSDIEELLFKKGFRIFNGFFSMLKNLNIQVGSSRFVFYTSRSTSYFSDYNLEISPLPIRLFYKREM